MQTLGELRYAFLLTPLLIVFCMYFVSGNLPLLGTNFLLSLIGATVASVVVAYIPLTGNSEATFLSFAVGFAGLFWGLSIAGILGAESGIALWSDSVASFLEGRPSYTQLNPNMTQSSLNVNALNSINVGIPSFGGWTGIQIWGTVMVALSFMYGLGIYLMVTSRGH